MKPLRAAFTSLPAFRCLSTGHSSVYVQGQSPEPRIREYFYYVDHQGQLFLDDTKVKNFVTCFKDKHFLVFFFSRLRANQSGRYQDRFPFLSLCGRERNFLRCDDRPVVFTHLLLPEGGASPELLSYCGGAERLAAPFRPQALYVNPPTGRLYHPCAEREGGVGLVRSALAMELSSCFVYGPEEDGQSGRPEEDGQSGRPEEDGGQSGRPTHFVWKGRTHALTNELAASFPPAEDDEGER